MAGLQQYYFFPTDFFYPRPPKPATTTAELPSLETLKDGETRSFENKAKGKSSTTKLPPSSTHHHNHNHHHALVYCAPNSKKQYVIESKQSKLSTKPLSYMVSLGEEDLHVLIKRCGRGGGNTVGASNVAGVNGVGASNVEAHIQKAHMQKAPLTRGAHQFF
ncbi:hypothetical protein PIB30_046887 [Stylosanthes scabra]|uniref:Uncharacterized protein n=1 Tax=Stylosanthes scabra TaxID=79078 RepID=A0ABU6THL8_9FABA|nr:hypothetical protein [Stylosanthes scabra]